MIISGKPLIQIYNSTENRQIPDCSVGTSGSVSVSSCVFALLTAPFSDTKLLSAAFPGVSSQK